MSKINILFVVAGFGVGGGERHLLLLADLLPRERYRLFFACTDLPAFRLELSRRSIECFAIRLKRKFELSAVQELKSLIVDKKIDIVHTHGARASFHGRIAARLAGASVVVSTVHNSLYDYPVSPVRKSVYIAADRLTAGFCDRIICVSEAIARDLIMRTGVAREKISVIHNGIDAARLAQQAPASGMLAEWGISVKEKKIGIIGRLTHQKGHTYLFQAVEKLAPVFPDLKCLIVGQGDLEKRLKEEVSRRGIADRCFFTGVRNDVSAIMPLLDMLILPSVSEGFPMVVLEAMAASVPVIAARVGGVGELIRDGCTGLLVEPKDPEALAAAITVLVKDPPKARLLAEAARAEVFASFTADITVRRTAQVYEECLLKKRINALEAGQ